MRFNHCLQLFTGLLGVVVAHVAAAQDLQQRLLTEGTQALAEATWKDGDAKRGAILFHQPHLACAKCHDTDRAENEVSKSTALGPDLAPEDDVLTDEGIIESILLPSKIVKKGFETINLELADGRTLAGLLAKQTTDSIVLLGADGSQVTIAKSQIEKRQGAETSIMPAGLANQLTSRQQFLDLVRYLVEIRAGGHERARELRPPPSLLVFELPAYEARVDHAGFIRSFDDKAFERGRRIYERLCQNCHGTLEQPGSLPTSRRFASEPLKNGSDPFAMYQTLTRGFGQMPPQNWMVPQEKYDVVHYIRETFLRQQNPSQYAEISDDYLKALPPGDTRGPAPRAIEPWLTMNYGPTLINTYEIGTGGTNIAQKGIAVRLDPGPGGVARGKAWMIFDHDTLRMAGAWTARGFIDWRGVHFNGEHAIHPHVVGEIALSNPTGPGWADPETGSFDDNQRVVGRDGRRYGPLPRAWARYRGLYHHGDQAVFAYTVRDTEVLESPSVTFLKPAPSTGSTSATPVQNAAALNTPVFIRTFHIGSRAKPMLLLVATQPSDARIAPYASAQPLTGESAHGPSKTIRFSTSNGSQPGNSALVAGLSGDASDSQWRALGNRLCLSIPAGSQPLRFAVWMARETAIVPIQAPPAVDVAPRDLTAGLAGGPPRWPEILTTEVTLGHEDGSFAVDVLTHPVNNPWLAQMRLSGLDFYPDGDRAVVCAWDGDVWLVTGLNGMTAARGAHEVSKPRLTWQRIASGLFQPLGIKIVDGDIYVTCRDQLVILRDKNGDGETDFYECFNNDHQVTEHFHEFAMGLQVDDKGNFYYAKSARHALPAVVPHHGTLLRIAADGSKTEIVATGFRAANGVCLNPDGTFFVTDQEGHWTPKNRINWVKEGKFYGNMFAYHNVQDSSNEAMEQPLCWITNEFDRSPGELVWVPPDTWGPLGGSLLNLSYGYGKIFVVPFEDVGGQKQGGMCALPIQLPTGVMRGRFHPHDRQLYCCGMFAWAGSATQPGGFYRIRYTSRPMWLPVGLHARRGELSITFTDPLDEATARNEDNYTLKTWSLKRSAEYGSRHFNEKPLSVESVQLSADRRTITLKLPELLPTWGMEIACRLKSADGSPQKRVLHNSIFRLRD